MSIKGIVSNNGVDSSKYKKKLQSFSSLESLVQTLSFPYRFVQRVPKNRAPCIVALWKKKSVYKCGH